VTDEQPDKEDDERRDMSAEVEDVERLRHQRMGQHEVLDAQLTRPSKGALEMPDPLASAERRDRIPLPERSSPLPQCVQAEHHRRLARESREGYGVRAAAGASGDGGHAQTHRAPRGCIPWQQHGATLSTGRPGPTRDTFGYGSLVGSLKRIAPIFPVRDLRASLAHYQRLGFATREYDGGGYGYATLDGVEIHLGVAPNVDAHASAYLFVEDADELAMAWRSAGAEVRTPEDTEWGQHEGVLIDPDGNVIRFGSPMKLSTT
jgi:hypothetical protein